MANESLSQNEIDALLGGAATPAAAPEVAPSAERPSPSEPLVYDFRRPHRIPREKRRTMDAIYERCATQLEGWLVNRVRGPVELRLVGVEAVTFGELTATLPTPCASFTFEVKETGGHHGLIDIGHEFAYFLVDRLFGGCGTPGLPNRSMTPIERMAVRVAADRALTSLQQVWQDHLPLELAIAGFESIPEMLRVARREDPMLVATLEATASNVRSQIVLCMPFPPLESFFATTNAQDTGVVGTPAEQAQNRELAERSVRGSRMWIAARLPEFRISMRELLGLTSGSVLATGLPRAAPLDVLVNTQRRFLATPGRLGSSLAVRLTAGVLPAPEPDAISVHRA